MSMIAYKTEKGRVGERNVPSGVRLYKPEGYGVSTDMGHVPTKDELARIATERAAKSSADMTRVALAWLQKPETDTK